MLCAKLANFTKTMRSPFYLFTFLPFYLYLPFYSYIRPFTFTCLLPNVHHGDARPAELHVLVAEGRDVRHGGEVLADELAEDA